MLTHISRGVHASVASIRQLLSSVSLRTRGEDGSALRVVMSLHFVTAHSLIEVSTRTWVDAARLLSEDPLAITLDALASSFLHVLVGMAFEPAPRLSFALFLHAQSPWPWAAPRVVQNCQLYRHFAGISL